LEHGKEGRHGEVEAQYEEHAICGRLRVGFIDVEPEEEIDKHAEEGYDRREVHIESINLSLKQASRS
jgi:hypothetical protein